MQNIHYEDDVKNSLRPWCIDIHSLKGQLSAGRETSGAAGHSGSEIDAFVRYVKAHSLEPGAHPCCQAKQQTRATSNIKHA